MRIGIDACCWANERGYGRFTRELVAQMTALAAHDEFVCFLDPWAAERFELRAPNARTVQVAQSAAPTRAASAQGYRSLRDMWRLTRAVWAETLDVFFSPSVYTYFPLPPYLPAVVAVHDVIAEQYPELTLPSARARLFWRSKVRLALWQARLVLTVSEFSARKIATVLGVPRRRIRVATEAPAPVFQPSESASQVTAAAARAGLPPGARWLAYVGGFNPHKHVDVIVRAHAAVARRENGRPPFLLLIGSADRDAFHSDLRRIRAAIAEAGTEALVRWTGYVPDEELRHLLSGALALLLPSACEGFGLPAVEAAACGTPVVATIASPLPELLSGGGLFIPPGDEAALTAALRTLLADETGRAAMGTRARAQVSRLSWSQSAATALETLREAAA